VTDTTLSQDLDALCATAHEVWERARNAEQAAWSEYKIGEDKYRIECRQQWSEAQSLSHAVGAAVGMIERVCKAAANMTAGGSGTEA
jgi:hypothetical protein